MPATILAGSELNVSEVIQRLQSLGALETVAAADTIADLVRWLEARLSRSPYVGFNEPELLSPLNR